MKKILLSLFATTALANDLDLRLDSNGKFIALDD